MSRPACRVAFVGGQTDLCVDVRTIIELAGLDWVARVSQKSSERDTNLGRVI